MEIDKDLLERKKIIKNIKEAIEKEQLVFRKNVYEVIPVDIFVNVHKTGKECYENFKKSLGIREETKRRLSKGTSSSERLGTEFYSKEEFMKQEIVDEIFSKFSTFFESIEKMIADEIEKEPRKIRIYLVGHTGSCKSSLINAIVGKYESEIGTTKPTTTGVVKYDIPDVNAVFVDTRGINEGKGLEVDKSKTAEDQLFEEINADPPDIVLYCTTLNFYRTNGTRTAPFLKKLSEKVNRPMILVLTKIDDNLGIDINPNDKEEIMENAKKEVQEIAEKFKSESVTFDAFLACQTKQFWNKRKNSLDLSNVIGIDEVRNTINSYSSLSAQMKLWNDSAILSFKRAITMRIIKASVILTCAMAPIPFVEAPLVGIIRALQLRLLSALLQTDDKNFTTFLNENKIYLGASFAAHVLQSGLAITLDVLAPATFGLGYLLSTSTSLMVQPALTIHLGLKAFEYFTGNPPIDNLINEFKML